MLCEAEQSSHQHKREAEPVLRVCSWCPQAQQLGWCWNTLIWPTASLFTCMCHCKHKPQTATLLSPVLLVCIIHVIFCTCYPARNVSKVRMTHSWLSPVHCSCIALPLALSTLWEAATQMQYSNGAQQQEHCCGSPPWLTR